MKQISLSYMVRFKTENGEEMIAPMDFTEDWDIRSEQIIDKIRHYITAELHMPRELEIMDVTLLKCTDVPGNV